MANVKSRKRRNLTIFIVVLLLAAGGAGWWFFLRKKEQVIIVQTEKVTRRTLTELVVANGRIQPVVQVVIQPEVSGEITDSDNLSAHHNHT